MTESEIEVLLVATLSRLDAYQKAKVLQNAAEAALMRAGFDVSREVAAPYPGLHGTRAGRIDLWAKFGRFEAAIEIDRGAPRRKSISKLASQRREVVRVIVIRDPKVETVSVIGIDRIVVLGRSSFLRS